ncbi:unnamed protein product [Blepharisma stoltei]|uniref:Uncharacterized protein n=1 Tax=Blepharisma stoltei TaxID=1481888 RepID=A0AAU9IY33_9CILI|nr:unnamed protein product [Blepharisma stoltei]
MQREEESYSWRERKIRIKGEFFKQQRLGEIIHKSKMNMMNEKQENFYLIIFQVFYLWMVNYCKIGSAKWNFQVNKNFKNYLN